MGSEIVECASTFKLAVAARKKIERTIELVEYASVVTKLVGGFLIVGSGSVMNARSLSKFPIQVSFVIVPIQHSLLSWFKGLLQASTKS